MWEYKTLFAHPTDLTEITKLGAESWEAFSTAPIGGISDFWVIWLKRLHTEAATKHLEAAVALEETEKRRGRPPKE